MSRSRRPPPEVTLDIVDLSADGCGRGWHEEREVHLRHALPGESVTGVIRKRSRGIWLGDAVTIHSPSRERLSAPCAVAQRCGGCTFQHWLQAAELNRKEAELLGLLERTGIRVERLLPAVQSPVFGYRRKARLGVRRVGDRVFIGFREAFSGRVVDMDDCPVLDPRLSALISPLRRIVGASSVAAAVPQIEMAAGDTGTAVVIRHLAPLANDDLDQLAVFAMRTGTGVWLQPGGPETVAHHAGPAELLSYANPDFGLLFRFAPLEFVQVNATINRQLVRAAVLALADCGDVLDLFCGLGNFSVALARAGHRVTGIEAAGAAVIRARENAALNGTAAETSFHAEDLYGPAGENLPGINSCDALLLDPPRSGAGPNLRHWLTPLIRKVVYVSCNPRTFASDAAVFRDAGFLLAQAGIFDMFPRTGHVETFGVFERRGGSITSPPAETMAPWSR